MVKFLSVILQCENHTQLKISQIGLVYAITVKFNSILFISNCICLNGSNSIAKWNCLSYETRINTNWVVASLANKSNFDVRRCLWILSIIFIVYDVYYLCIQEFYNLEHKWNQLWMLSNFDMLYNYTIKFGGNFMEFHGISWNFICDYHFICCIYLIFGGANARQNLLIEQ